MHYFEEEFKMIFSRQDEFERKSKIIRIVGVYKNIFLRALEHYMVDF